MANFVFYDTETTGKDQRDFIQVIQVASILTNSHLDQSMIWTYLVDHCRGLLSQQEHY